MFRRVWLLGPSGGPAPTSAGHSAMTDPTAAWPPPRPPDCNAALVLADGTVFWGRGIGATGPGGRRSLLQHLDHRLSGNPDRSVLCRRRSSPSPFPISAMSAPITRTSRRRPRRRAVSSSATCLPSRPITAPSSRSMRGSNRIGVIGLCGVDTRRLTRLIRDSGPPNGVIAYHPDGRLDLAAMRDEARAWPGLEGMDLAHEVTCRQSYEWAETAWRRERRLRHARKRRGFTSSRSITAPSAISCACSPSTAAGVTVVPATATRRGDHAPRARRHLSVERPGRPGRDRPNTPCRCCAS